MGNVHKRVSAQINYRGGYYANNYEFLQASPAYFVSGWFGAFLIFLILYFTHFLIKKHFWNRWKYFWNNLMYFFPFQKIDKIDTIKIGDS